MSSQSDSVKNDEAELEHWWQVMRNFLHYADFYGTELERRQAHLNNLSDAHANRLPEITFEKFSTLQELAQKNQDFLDDMVQFYSQNAFCDPPAYAVRHAEQQRQQQHMEATPLLPLKDIGPPVDITQQHRNVATVHSLYREWSAAGQRERQECFQPIIEQLESHLPLVSKVSNTQQYLRVCVPGCGLARLPLEIASRGYCCEANEYSSYMVIASNFMLNGVQNKESYDIAPWITSICNVVHVADTFETVKIPDITAVDMMSAVHERFNAEQQDDCPFPRFSFSAGNFVEIYTSPEQRGAWDCVVTCFFLDTAPVVIDYVETIFEMLKPGGIWINLGPLLYHWVSDVDSNGDDRYAQSIELSYEELRHVISTFGFENIHEEFRNCTYTKLPKSMMHTVYNAALFTVRKPLVAK